MGSSGRHELPPPADRTFEAIVFDWDGTAVAGRHVDATGLRHRCLDLTALGAHLVVVTGTHVGNVDDQLRARPTGPGRLLLCVNRGSEVFEATATGVEPRFARVATREEDEALDRAAAATVAELGRRGLEAAVVSQRRNRRKIDLIPEPAWAEPPKARIADLLDAVAARLRRTDVADLVGALGVAADAARRAGLVAPRITTDVKHLEIGLTDKADAARWAAGWLAARGITGELVAIVGDELAALGGLPGSDALLLVPELARAAVFSVGVEPSGALPAGVCHLPGGPARFADLLDDQRHRRAAHRVPAIDRDPAWIVEIPVDDEHAAVAASLGALSTGSVGVRSAREEGGGRSDPMVLVAGAYTPDDDGGRLVALPAPTALEVEAVPVDPAAAGERRVLDLRTGVLVREGPTIRSVRFGSVVRPDLLALRAEGPQGLLRGGDPFQGREAGAPGAGGPVAVEERPVAGGSVAIGVRTVEAVADGRRVVERLASAARAPGDAARVVTARIADHASVGFDRLLAEHRARWAQRWAGAAVDVEGSPDDELAARFAVFHLLGAVGPDVEEAAVGARGLTGPGYAGHVFWDADVHVLPALAALDPPRARAMLEYRRRRLPAARALATERRRRGARFPWESAWGGGDVTPDRVRSGGRDVEIRTGEEEEHIVADVAWASEEYLAWSGDTVYDVEARREVLLETARYWASRITLDPLGVGHIAGVMGPDEYHHGVDDDAYTNGLARWNLDRAAAVLGQGDVAGTEVEAWRDLAGRLADGWDPAVGAHEQFAGYWRLEPLRLVDVGEPPIAADQVLGADRVAGSQIIKQADVLLLHHLVPHRVRPGSLEADLDVYEPRTAHGSSLSPAIHAALLARAGRPDRALDLFRLASRIDLDDSTGSTGAGLHLAAMGGVWQSLAYGFLGIRPRPGHLRIDPHLPAEWRSLVLRCRFQGTALEIRATRDDLEVACDAEVAVRVPPGPARRLAPPGSAFRLR